MWRKTGIVVALLGILLLTAPVLAGGWAVVTVDSLPAEVRAGETLTIGFMVRQHGQTPTNGVSPMLTALNRATGERLTAQAQQSGETGHFVVDVIFPSEGQWEWSIVGVGPEPQFAPLTVLPSVASLSDAVPAPAVEAFPLRETLRLTALALMVAAGALAVAGLKQRKTVSVPVAGD